MRTEIVFYISSYVSHQLYICDWINVIGRFAFIILSGQNNFGFSSTQELINYFFSPTYLYSVCYSTGVKLEKIGETDSSPLIKHQTSPPPFLRAFPPMKKHMASLEPTEWQLAFKISVEMEKWGQCQFSCYSSFT